MVIWVKESFIVLLLWRFAQSIDRPDVTEQDVLETFEKRPITVIDIYFLKQVNL